MGNGLGGGVPVLSGVLPRRAWVGAALQELSSEQQASGSEWA